MKEKWFVCLQAQGLSGGRLYDGSNTNEVISINIREGACDRPRRKSGSSVYKPKASRGDDCTMAVTRMK